MRFAAELIPATLVDAPWMTEFVPHGGAVPCAFESSLGLLETGLFQRHGIAHVSVAGYPEGHPRIAASALDAALAAKKSLARRAGIDLQVVTQFCFESEPVLSWTAKMKGSKFRVTLSPAGTW